jgi:hypothetical protein
MSKTEIVPGMKYCVTFFETSLKAWKFQFPLTFHTMPLIYIKSTSNFYLLWINIICITLFWSAWLVVLSRTSSGQSFIAVKIWHHCKETINSLATNLFGRVLCWYSALVQCRGQLSFCLPNGKRSQKQFSLLSWFVPHLFESLSTWYWS